MGSTLSRKVCGEIRAILGAWFSELVVADWDPSSKESAEESLERLAVRSAEILVRIAHTQSEFLTAIHIDKWPEPHGEAVGHATMVGLARIFAGAFTCRTICDCSACGDDESPYWSIIWDAGRSFLADTCNTRFEDEAGGEVGIVREVSLPACKLDDSGRPVVHHG